MLMRNPLLRRRWVWVAAAGAVALSAVGGVWWVRDSTAPTDDYDRVVAELRASERAAADNEAQLRVARAEIASLSDEIAELTSPTMSPDPIEMEVELRDRASGAQARLAMWRDENGDRDASRGGDEFVVATDSICRWFTAEMMNDVVLLAQSESRTFPHRRATFDPFVPGGCRTSDSQSWVTEGWPDIDAGLRIELGHVATDPRPSASDVDPGDFRPHHLLHESVTYAGLDYGGGFSPGIRVQLRVEGHDDVLFFALGVTNQLEAGVLLGYDSPTNRYEWLGFEVANLMLERMGWTTP